jgi:hypothetical protein
MHQTSTHDARYFTSKCAEYGHAEFEINVSTKGVPRTDIDWMLGTLEAMVARGDRFKAGETMQIGWMLTQLEPGERGSLGVMEPDRKSLPIVFVDSVTHTIRDLRAQKDTVESVLPPGSMQFPTLRHSLVVRGNYVNAQRLMLMRLAPHDATDSGWRLSDLDESSEAPEAFARISLYQLGLDRPELVKFFALPQGVQIALDGRIYVLKDGAVLPVKQGSFLDLLDRREVDF